MTHILKVNDAHISILKSLPPQWSIHAEGIVATSGWSSARLQPRFYLVFPSDGIQDFDFVADPPSGMHNPAITPVSASVLWPDPPAYVRGIRIHSANGHLEVFSEGSREFAV